MKNDHDDIAAILKEADEILLAWGYVIPSPEELDAEEQQNDVPF